MKIDIRNNIQQNFKDTSIEEMRQSIEDSLAYKEEITLPGLGVFFELLWENSNQKLQNQILETIKQAI